MQRYAITVEYIGTNYNGSQKQPFKDSIHGVPIRTIQGELETAISTLTKTNTKTIFSGRTDAGVHSKGQVVHFDTELKLDEEKFVNSLNGILPEDISVKGLKIVSSRFHAQKSAKGRHYRYIIANRIQRSAWDSHCLLVRYPLDIERMNESLSYLEGEHDFTAFKKIKTNNPAKVCKMYKCSVTRSCQYYNDYIYIDLIADRFLYNMVRAIVGTLLLIERNNLPPSVMKEILESRDRTKVGMTVSSEGLTLMRVIYNNIDGEIK